MIKLKDVQVKIQNRVVLDHVNLELNATFNYLITGSNGSGKTVLLKLIGGQIQPFRGSIHYSFINEDLDWDSKFELRKQYIHLVLTQALHSLLKGQDIYYQQRYYSIEEDAEQTVRKYFGDHLSRLKDFNFPASFQMDHLLELEINRLSNGQLKKVIILKRLLESIPKVLLLDYPFEGLDRTSREELSEFLDHLSVQYKVQLIIADHQSFYLPKSIVKKVTLSVGGANVIDLDRDNNVNSANTFDVIKSKEGSGDVVVEMRKVNIQYGDKIIIKDLDWHIKKSERWALTGRNGSGKTTLFSLIYADHPLAYSNEIYLFGRRRGTGESIWDIKKRISYLGPEQIHFLDHHVENLTAREYLQKFNIDGLASLLKFFELDNLLTTKLKQLSNGQLQLVMLVALFLEKKELLLLDEPFQFLDTQQKDRVSYYLETLLDINTTLILITHFEDDVARWTSRRLSL